MSTYNSSYPAYAKVIHLGFVLFGVSAFLTGELAEDGSASFGYLLHAYLGLLLLAFILIRIGVGVVSSGILSFKTWSPFSRIQWGLALEDFRALFSLHVPHREKHQGLAGVTQAFGLVIFAWMAATGTLLFILGGGPESEFFEIIEEIHEVGESIIPLYLILHVGAVILHTLSGSHVWKRMFSLRDV